jgi:hypothetical protein
VTLTSAYLYPWDVDGDPAAAARIADLGIGQVCLAAAYHEVRAITPFHPRHRIVTRDAAVYYQPDARRWKDAALSPAVHASEDSDIGTFGKSALEMQAAGLRVSAWLVINHNETLGAAHPEAVVRNAFGDPYPWALCPASPATAEYAALLAAEVAALPYVDGIELEACGWYGFDHGSAHDKTGLSGGSLDLCFCASCEDVYRAAGLDVERAREAVRAAFDERALDTRGSLETSASAGLVEALLAVRDGVAADFLRAVIAAARKEAPGKPVLIHTHPDPRECGSNPGFDAAAAAAADGAILGAPPSPSPAAQLVTRAVATYKGQPERIAVSLPSVSALGAPTAVLPSLADAVLEAGASELRFYHGGLASAADLAVIREVATGLALQPGGRPLACENPAGHSARPGFLVGQEVARCRSSSALRYSATTTSVSSWAEVSSARLSRVIWPPWIMLTRSHTSSTCP